MKVDLSRQEVTDVHCFSFSKTELTRAYLTRLFIAGGPTVMSVRTKSQAGDLDASIAFGRLVNELADLLGTPRRHHEVLVARGIAARRFDGYVERLFKDATIERVALDNGIEPVPFEEFRKYASAKTHRIFRIEPLIKRLLEDSKTFSELVGDFEEKITAAVRKEGFAGFKTVIAYRTGLDIGSPDEAHARASFRSGMKDKAWFGPRVKPLRDYLVHRTAEVASKTGVFLQIHTGLGDTDILADKCSPLLLQRFLKQQSVLETPVILIHGGFPYTREAAWLCSMLPNLYFELSSPFPPTFLPALSKSRFEEVLEIVPATRILYGSDAIETPEFHWLSAKLAKKALAASLEGLVDQHLLSEDDAYKTADMVLNRNALRFLG